MADFTIEHLDAVPDKAPDFGFGDMQEVHFAKDALDAVATGLMFMRVRPGKRNPFGHRHEDAEEVYVVVGGSGRVRLDDEIREVGRLDAIRVAPRVVRAFEAGPDGLEVLVFGPHHAGDGEIVRDFWPAD